ncbi:hypothetical protein K461DRAFT_293372 [Myriangium duriaei CBS 260.36]|uniref:Uncharacterized protein n=1 Tax=Myriangium duriaei CBS 260.36 TaxID=1168546 RepID=A0A9P4J260_9PEZI|nr:hypothetical protein K461DRAFT_293372 [Myriangium duriaei CBS 260.36]
MAIELLNNIPPLRGSENYRQWRRNIKLALFAHNLDSFLEENGGTTKYPTKVQFEREEAKAVLLIRCHCTEQVLQTLGESDNVNARQLWNHLNFLFGQPNDNWYTAYERFYDLRYNGDAQKFVNDFRHAHIRCQDQGFPIDDSLAVFHLVKILQATFPAFVKAKCGHLSTLQAAPSLESILKELLNYTPSSS